VWYQLAELELQCGVEIGFRSELRARLKGTEYTYPEGTLSRCLIGAASAKHDVEAMLQELPRNFHLMTFLNRPPTDSSLDTILHTELTVNPVQPSQWHSPEYFDSFRLAVLAFSVCAVSDNREDAMVDFLNKLRDQVAPTSKCGAFIELLLSNRATFENDDLLNLVASSLALCRTLRANLAPDQAALVTVYFAIWLNQSNLDDFIAEPIVQFICQLWSRICKEKRALLRAPNLFVPQIEAICNNPVMLATTLAELSLAIDGVTSYCLPPDLRAKLKTFMPSAKTGAAEIAGHDPIHLNVE
jgi:hypothetical protein